MTLTMNLRTTLKVIITLIWATGDVVIDRVVTMGTMEDVMDSVEEIVMICLNKESSHGMMMQSLHSGRCADGRKRDKLSMFLIADPPIEISIYFYVYSKHTAVSS
mmetsp:Transcript_34047/g.82353  ORF Transcript_34047/g.82353 Transcript_34047/m.82353 type:complete len:105 (-) Transcript_34047:77-391(-)